MGLLDTSYGTVSANKPKKSDRILPRENMNIRGLLDAATAIPFAGDLLSGGLAAYDAAKGDYGSAAMNALSVLPILSAGMVKKAGNVADAVNAPKLTEFDKYKSTFDDISRQVEKAKANFSADRSRANLDEYNRLLQKRDDAQSIMEQWRPKEAPVESYQGQHSAPMKDSGAPLNNITKDGYYPEDVYGPNGLRYYGTGDEKLDAAAYSVIRQAQGNPFAQVKMYRAVPSDAPSVINNGDWVTTVRQYAKDHGDSALNGDYRIVSKTVPAKKLFTNGDSWLEFGYDQSGRINPALAGAMAGGGLLGLGGYSLMGDQ